MSKYKNLIKNIGLFAISNVALKLITFLLTPLLTFYLTTKQFGVTDMLNTCIWLITPIVTLSIADAALRFLVEDAKHKQVYISISFYLTLLGCFAVLLLLPVLDFRIFGGLGEYKLEFLFAFIAMSFQTLFSNLARGLNEVTTMAWASIVSAITNAALSVILIALFHMGIMGFFISLIIGNLVACIFYLVKGHYLTYIIEPSVKMLPFCKSMLLYSLPIIPNSVFWWVNQGINRFFITGMLGIGLSGLFAVASRIPGILNLVSGIFQQAWNLSAFQEYKAKNRDTFFSTVFRLYNVGMVFSVALLIPACKFLARLFFQKDFYKAWFLIPVLLLSFYYSAISAFLGSVFTSSLKTKYLFLTTAIGAITCVIFNYILIKMLGLQGAAIASALSNAIVALARLFFANKILDISYSKAYLLLTNALVICSVCVMVLDDRGTALSFCVLGAITFISFFEVKSALTHRLITKDHSEEN